MENASFQIKVVMWLTWFILLPQPNKIPSDNILAPLEGSENYFPWKEQLCFKMIYDDENKLDTDGCFFFIR